MVPGRQAQGGWEHGVVPGRQAQAGKSAERLAGRRMEPRAHRAVLADALAALDGLLVVTQCRRLAVKRAQLDVGAELVVEESAGAVLGLGAAPVLARA